MASREDTSTSSAPDSNREQGRSIGPGSPAAWKGDVYSVYMIVVPGWTDDQRERKHWVPEGHKLGTWKVILQVHLVMERGVFGKGTNEQTIGV